MSACVSVRVPFRVTDACTSACPSLLPQVVGAGGSGGTVFANQLSDEVRDMKKSAKMWELSNKITGATWPKA
eukprot:24624-Eustigmatos_ZCMA.PRE.1